VHQNTEAHIIGRDLAHQIEADLLAEKNCDDTAKDNPELQGEGHLILNSTEISTGYTRSMTLLNNLPNISTMRKLSYSSEFILFLTPDTGDHLIYSLEAQIVIGSVRKKVAANSHLRPVFSVSPKTHPNLFITFVTEDVYYIIYIIKKNPPNESQSFEIKLMEDMKLEKLFVANKLGKLKDKLTNIISHPHLPILFFHLTSGAVQVE
jgi:hypothetical protein